LQTAGMAQCTSLLPSEQVTGFVRRFFVSDCSFRRTPVLKKVSGCFELSIVSRFREERGSVLR
jgi:hypothetical protein